jgi:hypothetical protein
VNFVQSLIESGRAIDIVLAVIVVEAIILIAAWRRPWLATLLALLPGACLLLALRAAITDAGWAWIAFWVTLSFPVHLADLAIRTKKEPARPGQPHISDGFN